jgi:DNA excision repair protein ERCC-3
LREYAKTLGYPYIDSEVKAYEKEKLLQFFQHLDGWNVLFISRVGDVGIDLPDANVAIQISSLFGSRRQEAQRLGRILRPKQQRKEGFQSYFYSLVSLGTVEMEYALKRQKFLIKQGYSFEIMTGDSIEEIIRERDDLKIIDINEQQQKEHLIKLKENLRR